MKNKYIIFDLDDTLYYEIDYLKSAYQEIASRIYKEDNHLYNKILKLYQEGKNVFDYLELHFSTFSKNVLLEIYRNHFPSLTLNEGALEAINISKSNNYKIGLITDGRSVTQRNKLKALNIENVFDKIIISEEFGTPKPCEKNFLAFHEANVNEYFYIGDNPQKDFIAPNRLRWTTICLLDKGYNIHKQSFNIDKAFLPKYSITSLSDLSKLVTTL